MVHATLLLTVTHGLFPLLGASLGALLRNGNARGRDSNLKVEKTLVLPVAREAIPLVVLVPPEGLLEVHVAALIEDSWALLCSRSLRRHTALSNADPSRALRIDRGALLHLLARIQAGS